MNAKLVCKPPRVLLWLMAVSVIAVACSSAEPGATTTSAPEQGGSVGDPKEAASLRNEIPTEVVNGWGITSVKRYLNIDDRQTTDHPYGPLTGSVTVLDLPLDQRIRASQAIVVGTVVAFSPPYYNSADGGFWHEPSSEAGRSILQDLTIDVERVLGDKAAITAEAGGQPGLTVVTIAGGQIEVSFDASIDPALLPEGLKPGQTYVEAMAPSVGVAEGDRVLLFLQREAAPWFGAPVDQAMPWGKSTVAGRPAVPVGTSSIVSIGDWQLLNKGNQVAEFLDRAVTLDEIEALAQAGLGQSLRDPSAPIGPGNMNLPGPDLVDNPVQPSDTGSLPTPADEPPHTHPELED